MRLLGPPDAQCYKLGCSKLGAGPGLGSASTGEDRTLAPLRAVTKKEAEVSPGVGSGE